MFFPCAEEGRQTNTQLKGEEENMAKKLQTPCVAPKRGLPWELKYKYAMGGYTGIFKAFLYAIREEFGAASALKIYERVSKFMKGSLQWMIE
jgi:hypothetical protein